MSTPDPAKIMETVRKMRADLKAGHGNEYIDATYADLKESTPHIFDMVVENKPGSFEILERMVGAAMLVKTGKKTQDEMDKTVGFELAKEYVYPNIDMSKETRQ
jgi:glucose-6-phosphate dehydrogenase assembly protein OpcA